MKSKSQISVEFLSTYGLMLAALVVVGAALYYFNFLNPNNYKPEKCVIIGDFYCADAYADSDGLVLLHVRNDFGTTITVTNISVVGYQVSTPSLPLNISTIGGVTPFASIPFHLDKKPSEGNKIRLRFTLRIKRASGSKSYNISGYLITKVNNPSLRSELSLCGDGVVQSEFGEECDDGNSVDDDYCSSSCKKGYCGDGIVQTVLGEECEPPNKQDKTHCYASSNYACDSNCKCVVSNPNPAFPPN